MTQPTKDERALMAACRDGDAAVVKKLLAKGTRAVTDGGSGLHLATIYERTEVAEMLLASGVDANVRNRWGGTPLVIAAMSSVGKPYFELLLAHGADVRVEYVQGGERRTLMDALLACEPLRAPIAKLLIERGAPVTPEQLRQIRGARSRATKEKATLDAHHDWAGLEAVLFAATKKAIARFGKKHASDVFCGFCFDCNVEAHGQVLFCLETARHRKAFGKVSWNPGNWAVQEFGNMDADKAWRARVKRLAGDDGIDAKIGERLLQSIARVAVRLKKEGAFSPLRRAADFDVFTIDHEETTRAARARMTRARRQR